MKNKKIHIISTIIVLSMLFTACASAANESGTPTVGLAETSSPTELSTETSATPSQQSTEPATTEPVTVEPSATETQPMESTETMTVTQALPSTGNIDPGLATNLVNFQVWTQDNQQIGTAEDLIVNLEDQKVDYIVLSVGGFLGIGSASIPVPWDAFEVNTTSTMSNTSETHPNSLTLKVNSDVLSNAPQLDPSMLPEIGQMVQDWDSEIQAFWQKQMNNSGSMESSTPVVTQTMEITASPQVTATVGMTATSELKGVALASKLMNTNVQNSDGQALGSISDGVIDITTGKIEYVLITPTSSESDHQWVPVPLDALGWDAQSASFMLVVNQSVFNNAPSFTPDQFPDTQQSGWDSEIKTYWEDHSNSGMK